ncbi:MAG: zinc-dependent metalloprotease [Planctomycetes bacterium]|nr:zinc-dependent metalloprotease [Planctomycetota bacterium]
MHRASSDFRFVTIALCLAAGSALSIHRAALAQSATPPAAPAADAAKPKDDSGLRPFDEVAKGYEKVVSTADGKGSLYTLWRREKDGGLLAELPAGWDSQKHFIAMTIATGETFAGLQSGQLYVYWKRLDNRLLLVAPETGNRSTGDAESKAGVKQVFTDRVLLDVPIVAMGPGGRPVIDLKEMLAGRVKDLFSAGGGVGGFLGSGLSQANARLAGLKSAKAFPENIEISYEMPTAGGRMQEFHYSISRIPDSTGYTPRVADERIGYFTTVYRDLGKFTEEDKWVRYINRWNLEKADPRLKVSPPKEPIIFYIEHTTPVRYRRYVREGVLRWNKAFEKIGIADAIQVYQQDAASGAHMDKDPEDVRYNFVRWVSNDIGTAIGPSRVHPLTGQILDADIILTDGWIRYFAQNYAEILPEIAMQGMTAETINWLDKHPVLDPRVRLADPAERQAVIDRIAQEKRDPEAAARRGVIGFGGMPLPSSAELASNPDLLQQRLNLSAALCSASMGKGFDMAMMRMQLDIVGMGSDRNVENVSGSGASVNMLDGIPEWFIGPLLVDLVSHECGHTLGLRHNFKGSSIYTLAQINSPDVKGKKSFSGSVMDYVPINMNVPDARKLEEYVKKEADAKKAAKPEDAAKAPAGLGGPDKPQDLGDYAQIDNGPYDYWAIEYGYGFDDPKKVLLRCNEPELAYGTDWDLSGPDPLVRQYDFTANPIDYANNLMDLARYHRSRLTDHFVKDGDSWAKARRGYNLTLAFQTRAIAMMARQVGGANVSYSKKGDPNGKDPVTPFSAEKQREALKWIIDNAFVDSAWELSPELLAKFTNARWFDQGGFNEALEDPAYPIHDRIAGIQTTALVLMMNPTTLRRVYDNEMRAPGTQDMLTLPELMDTIGKSVWTELDKSPGQQFTAREPMVSSLRRNLQRQHLEFLIFLTEPASFSGEASKPISNLALLQLRALQEKINSILESKSAAGRLDPYTLSHLTETNERIKSVLNSTYIYNR